MASTGSVGVLDQLVVITPSDGEILKHEYNRHHKSSPWLPEHHLMLAVLQDALHAILRGKEGDYKSAQACVEARAWVAATDAAHAYVFSFDALWDALFGAAGWSAVRARQQILNGTQGVLRRLKRLRAVGKFKVAENDELYPGDN